MGDFTLEPRGPFTLASAARFIAGWPPGQAELGDGEVRLAFLVDDWSGPARVVLRQQVVHGTVEADNEPRAIAQAARIVSLDHDGTGYPEVGERDAVVGALQRASGYLRPVLYPDEALTRLQELPGIGPFYAGLILLRAVGTVDVAPRGEPQLERAVQERYGAPLAAVSEQWKPFRTWVSVLMRAGA